MKTTREPVAQHERDEDGSAAEPRVVGYESIRRKIRDGDTFLVFRRKGQLLDTGIAAAGRSPAIHAGKLAWWRGRLMALETKQWIGGRAVHFSTVVEAARGPILIRRIRREGYDRIAAVKAMIDMTGKKYGWGNLLKASLLHMPFVRFLVTPDTDDKANGSLPFCSQAVSRADRAGGVDPVPNLSDRLTEPGDLARSAAYQDMWIIE